MLYPTIFGGAGFISTDNISTNNISNDNNNYYNNNKKSVWSLLDRIYQLDDDNGWRLCSSRLPMTMKVSDSIVNNDRTKLLASVNCSLKTNEEKNIWLISDTTLSRPEGWDMAILNSGDYFITSRDDDEFLAVGGHPTHQLRCPWSLDDYLVHDYESGGIVCGLHLLEETLCATVSLLEGQCHYRMAVDHLELVGQHDQFVYSPFRSDDVSVVAPTTVAAHDGIFCLGGKKRLHRNADRLKSVLFWDRRRNGWYGVPSMRDGRFKGAALVVDHRIYVVGGELSDETKTSTVCFDRRADRWSRLADIQDVGCANHMGFQLLPYIR